MKIKTLLVSGALLAGSYCGSASAEGLYAGGGLGMMDMSIDPSISVDEDSANLLFGRVGMQFNEYVSGEIRIGYGSGTAEFESMETEAPYYEYDFDRMAGAYFRFGAPVTESIYPYFLFGYTRVEYNVALLETDESVDASQEDMTFGVGLDYSITESLTASVEYTEYQDVNDGISNAGVSATRVKGLSVSVTMSF